LIDEEVDMKEGMSVTHNLASTFQEDKHM